MVFKFFVKRNSSVALKKFSKNTKRTYKNAQQVFNEYWFKKGLKSQQREAKYEEGLRRFYVDARVKHNSTDNSYLVLDKSAYHKILIQ